MLVLLILFCVGHQRFASRTPYLAGALVAFLVFVEAPISGTSLNPARSLAPAVLTRLFDRQWIYLTAPILGAIIAVKLFGALFEAASRAGCAKLYHTARYRCIFVDCAYCRFAAGAVVLREGDPSDHAYVVEQGELAVQISDAGGADIAVGRLGPGDWVGEMALLLDLPRTATVTAITDCQLRKVTRRNFAHVIGEHPVETGHLLRQLAERLHKANAARAGEARKAGAPPLDPAGAEPQTPLPGAQLVGSR